MKMVPLNDEDVEMVNGGTQIPYIIKNGDTLGVLSTKFNCSVEDICKWNNIKDPNKINAGQKLIFKY